MEKEKKDRHMKGKKNIAGSVLFGHSIDCNCGMESACLQWSHVPDEKLAPL